MLEPFSTLRLYLYKNCTLKVFYRLKLMINNVFFVIDPIVPNCISLIIYKFDHKSENFTEILRDGKKWYLSIVYLSQEEY